jgi:hypothetical protein
MTTDATLTSKGQTTIPKEMRGRSNCRVSWLDDPKRHSTARSMLATVV